MDSKYSVGRIVAKIVAGFGWLLLIASCLIGYIAFNGSLNPGMRLSSIIIILGGSGLGLVIVTAAQALTAILDIADNSFKSLPKDPQ